MREFIDPKNLPVGKQFMRRLIRDGVWILNGFSQDMAAPHPHVVIGRDMAAIIDTTDLDLDLRGYVQQHVTELPLAVLSTHSHADHTKNNFQFEDCPIYMSDVAWEEVRANREKIPERAPGSYTPIPVQDGDIIDLGDRKLECIEFCGCHSASSIAYLDITSGCLFTGDELEGGQVLLLSDTASVELYRDNLVKLRNRVQGRALWICPPHNGSPIDILMLDHIIENCERIMMGHGGEPDVRSMTFGLNPLGYDITWIEKKNALRSEWMGTSIVYNAKHIFKKDVLFQK